MECGMGIAEFGMHLSAADRIADRDLLNNIPASNFEPKPKA
jgi:hypothetical protein